MWTTAPPAFFVRPACHQRHYRRCSGRPVREDREVPVETGAPEGGAGEAVERGNNGQNYYELQPTVGGYQRQWSTARRHVASGGSACF